MPSSRREARRAAGGGYDDRKWPGFDDIQMSADEYYRLDRNGMGAGGGFEALRSFFDGHSRSRKSRFPKWGRTKLIGFALVLGFRHAKVGPGKGTSRVFTDGAGTCSVEEISQWWSMRALGATEDEITAIIRSESVSVNPGEVTGSRPKGESRYVLTPPAWGSWRNARVGVAQGHSAHALAQISDTTNILLPLRADDPNCPTYIFHGTSISNYYQIVNDGILRGGTTGMRAHVM